MELRLLPSNRHCVVQHVRSFSIPTIKRELRRGPGVSSDFRTLDTPLPAANKTIFKAYANRKELLLAVCLRDAMPARGASSPGGTDSIEVLFDCVHDQVGYYQFVFAPNGCLGPFHHVPYREAHSTAFPHLQVRQFSWELPDRRPYRPGIDPSGAACPREEAWLFVRFRVGDVFRNGNTCGLNVARNCGTPPEVSTWNPCSGHGMQDATSFGTLHRRSPVAWARRVTVEQTGRRLEIEWQTAARSEPRAFRLLNPHGEELPLSIRSNGRSRRAAVVLPRRVPGRYRLYPRAATGAPLEPRYLAFDLSFPRMKSSFALGMTYDCPDDLLLSTAPYSPAALAAEIDLLADHGVTRIHWIDYPPETLYEGRFAFDIPTAATTAKSCGDLLPLAARLAKKRGLEFIAIHKLFDLAMDPSCWDKTRLPASANTVSGLERRNIWVPTAIVKNQASTMQLNPAWHVTSAGTIARICLYSRQPIPRIRSPEIRLWVSRDNRKYELYRGRRIVRLGVMARPDQRWTPAGNAPEGSRSRHWYLELTGLHLDTPFLAIELNKPGMRIRSRRHAFVEAFDAQGNPAPVIAATAGDRQGGFFFYQEWQGWANKSPRMLEDCEWGPGVHGLTFQKHPNLPTLLEPACGPSRAIWLWHVQRILDTEADGVSIRTLCHHNNIMDYMMYAYAGPVRDSFRSLYRREPTPSFEDCQRVRRIRGDYVTEFFRAAKRLASRAGRRFVAHLEPGIEVSPDCDLRMQFYEDWETWIREGIVDEIILKFWFSQNPFIHEKVLPLARKLGVPVHICDRNSSLRTTARAVERAENLVRDALQAGFSGYAFYEMADYRYRDAANVPVLRAHTGDALRRAGEVIRSRP